MESMDRLALAEGLIGKLGLEATRDHRDSVVLAFDQALAHMENRLIELECLLEHYQGMIDVVVDRPRVVALEVGDCSSLA